MTLSHHAVVSHWKNFFIRVPLTAALYFDGNGIAAFHTQAHHRHQLCCGGRLSVGFLNGHHTVQRFCRLSQQSRRAGMDTLPCLESYT